MLSFAVFLGPKLIDTISKNNWFNYETETEFVPMRRIEFSLGIFFLFSVPEYPITQCREKTFLILILQRRKN